MCTFYKTKLHFLVEETKKKKKSRATQMKMKGLKCNFYNKNKDLLLSDPVIGFLVEVVKYRTLFPLTKRRI